MSRIDLHDPGQASPLLRVLETVGSWVDSDDGIGPNLAFDQLCAAVQRDGYRIDAGGSNHPPASWSRTATRLPQLPLGQVRDPAAILEHLDRLDRASDGDPTLAISSTKALIKATSKHVLDELDASYDERADIATLVRAVQPRPLQRPPPRHHRASPATRPPGRRRDRDLLSTAARNPRRPARHPDRRRGLTYPGHGGVLTAHLTANSSGQVRTRLDP